MSIRLVNKIRPMTGLTFAEKSILKELAATSHDDQTVFLRLDKLSLYCGCSVRTAQRALRALERKGVIIPQGEKPGGRGYVNIWRFNLDAAPHEEAAESPGVNGNAPPAPTESPPKRQFKSPNESVYDDPLARRPGESATHWAQRVDKLQRR